jgi:flagellar basal body rod protein FlgG
MERGTSETVGDGFIQEGDVVELSPAMVTMLSAQRGFQTALNVVHIEDEMDRALLDVLSKVQQQQ